MDDGLQSNRIRVPLEVPHKLSWLAEAFKCPVLRCPWIATTADIEAVVNTITKASGPSIDDAISALAIGRAAAIDAFIRKHLESHDVIDFLRTIRELEQQVYNAGDTGIRPHRRTTEMPGHELVRQRDEAQAEIVKRARGPHQRSISEALGRPPHRLEDMTGVERGRAAEILRRYEEIGD